MFATKPELAIEQLKRLMTAGIRAMRAAADEVYGRSGEFRAACRALSLAYVVIIPCDCQVTLAKDTVIRADQAISGAVFERRSCGNGTKGPRYSDWALIAAADPREYLLIRRLPVAGEEPVHLLPVPGAGRPPRHHDLFHHHRRAPLAGGSRPPLLPVKRDLSFTAALLVLLPAFRRFLPGVVPSGRGCSSRAGGPCARGARASAARRR